MIVLATATPNKRYEHYNNFKNVTLQAVYTDGRVTFKELQPGRIFTVSEDTVRSLFNDRLVVERPFLDQENTDFYAVLNRKRSRYAVRYNQILRLKTMTITRIR
jgi:hypothetical protein